jgi:signal transduction histidine kinase
MTRVEDPWNPARPAATTGQLRGHRDRLDALASTEREIIAELDRDRLLHDEVGQALTAIRINLLMLRRGGDAAAAEARIDDSLLIVERLLGGVRQLSLDLWPSLLDALGLAAALRWYVDAQTQRAGLGVRVSIDALAREPAPELAITCFRVAQEAVTKTVERHRAQLMERLEIRDVAGLVRFAIRSGLVDPGA